MPGQDPALIHMVTRKQTADGPSPEFKRIMDEEASLLAMIREGGNQSKLQRRFRRLVYRHYETQGRDFPWRRTDDPYHILVSEIMLQQTQTQRVAEKYASFIASFPGFESLAGAPLHDVLAAWQGLGYNRRALNLQKCARAIVGEHGGTLPENPDDLALLPGIGRATAASIAAFAFNKPVVFLETNIRTVFIYFFFRDRETVSDSELMETGKQMLDRTHPARWYNALMDYGVMLKKRHANPGRKSDRYRKQPSFSGSRRQLRGKIIAALVKSAQSEEELRRAAGPCGGQHDISGILDDLEQEGFVVRDKSGTYRISQDRGDISPLTPR